MKKRNNLFKWRLLVMLIMVFTLTIFIAPVATADSSIKLMVDGQDITSSVAPLIVNDRTLVPIRMVAEQLGAQVIWNNDERTVYITKGNIKVLLRIDSNLIEYNNDNGKVYNLSDVAAHIIKDRTFVPLRVVSNALGVGIEWDNSTRTIYVDSAKSSGITPFFDVKILSLENGQTITGTTNLQSILPNVLPNGAAEIKYLLLDSNTARGFVIARGTDFSSSYEWKPSIEDNGQKILISAIYDKEGKFLAGDAIAVQIGIIPKVSLNGITENQMIEDNMKLSANLNFTASYVKYEMVNTVTGDVYISPEWDPEDTFTMIPVMEDNEGLAIKVIAYDINNQPYSSETITLNINVVPQISLRGVLNSQTINKPVTLYASTNFNVSEIEYVMRDTKTGAEKTLSKVNYGSYNWFPGPEEAGNKELFIRVKDAAGRIYTSEPIYVYVSGSPMILLQGAGPNQVVAGPMKLNVLSNVTLDSVKFILINSQTGEEKVVAKGQDYLAEYTYTPVKEDSGSWKIKAEGIYNSNIKIETEVVPITIYLDKIYGPLPIIEKTKFLDMASELALDTLKETGMSAALQTAQAILETGWGQSIPVDKYKGQFSYNLFGIKGSGTKGSVISNTWEEYNGVTYRIDDKFRAYNSVVESWADHNNLLLTKERYEPFREAMHDSNQGAWALRRCGYATDSKYPLKLMNIIYLYDLKKLDEVGI